MKKMETRVQMGVMEDTRGGVAWSTMTRFNAPRAYGKRRACVKGVRQGGKRGVCFIL